MTNAERAKIRSLVEDIGIEIECLDENPCFPGAETEGTIRRLKSVCRALRRMTATKAKEA